jgi:hypothetical protein
MHAVAGDTKLAGPGADAPLTICVTESQGRFVCVDGGVLALFSGRLGRHLGSAVARTNKLTKILALLLREDLRHFE